MKKKGIQLSVNFIVMFILSITMFSFGLILLKNMLDAGNKQMAQIPKVEDAILENCKNRMETICVAKNKKEVKKGESISFGIAILNRVEQETEFSVFSSFSIITDEHGNEIEGVNVDMNDWSFETTDPSYSNIGNRTIQNMEYEKILIPFFVPKNAKDGTYVFNLNLCYKDDLIADAPVEKCPDQANFPDQYDTTHKLYITIR